MFYPCFVGFCFSVVSSLLFFLSCITFLPIWVEGVRPVPLRLPQCMPISAAPHSSDGTRASLGDRDPVTWWRTLSPALSSPTSTDSDQPMWAVSSQRVLVSPAGDFRSRVFGKSWSAWNFQLTSIGTCKSLRFIDDLHWQVLEIAIQYLLVGLPDFKLKSRSLRVQVKYANFLKDVFFTVCFISEGLRCD